MFGLGKRSQEKYQNQLEEFAKSCQFGFFIGLRDKQQIIVPDANDSVAGIIVAAITNWIFRFGDYGPKIYEDPALKPLVDAALAHCARVLGNEDDIVEMTVAVIIAAAAQNIQMPMFTAHFDKLAALGIVKKNINLYVPLGNRPVHIDRFLRGQHQGYYHYMQYA